MHAFVVDGLRTPIGRYGGSLSGIRADDLAALSIKALLERNPGLDPAGLDEVVFGNTNQAGEDSRNVARMAGLLAGVPETVPAITVNRLCASGLDAVAVAATNIQANGNDVAIAGGVESMSRAPFVMPKPETAFSRQTKIYDTTIGWRFENPALEAAYGTESMPQTADNVAEKYGVNRADQDAFALRSQARWKRAHDAGVFAEEILPVTIPRRKADPVIFDTDEHPRPNTELESLARLRAINGPGKTVTAGNASGVNDGAAALLLASSQGCARHGLKPIAKIVGAASAGVSPSLMGIGPVPAVRKLLDRTGVSIDEIDVIELNEAFASQGIAVLRELGIAEDSERVNPNGGAIAMGHPLGMSGARLVLTAARQLARVQGRFALCTMCVGVGQGVALLLSKVSDT
ncbi:3-oxoadipyl-CoA thiolase [Ruegeria sp. SCP11]|uniref:3-oxoadipyl-CoA thiolase n=1 Tax=Ruegeria sp. SCP11 TaxID=3141378 RepID=UPI003339AC35